MTTTKPGPQRDSRAVGNILDILSAIERRESRKPGVVLFRQGEPPNGCYVIHQGQIQLSAMTPGGLRHDVRTATAGDVIGLEAVICGKGHDATAETLTNCTIGFLESGVLLAYLRANTAHCFPVLQLLSDNLNSTYQSARGINIGARRRNGADAR
jgi:CRP-like cAMP-binding protein